MPAPKNLMGKARKPGNPYLVFDGPFGRTEVLKSWQADNSKPYGRWFVAVNGDMGDSYVYDIVHYGHLLEWDREALTDEYVREVYRAALKSPKAVF